MNIIIKKNFFLLFFLIISILEFLIFSQHVQKYVAPFYNMNHDGADIIRNSYLAYEMFQSKVNFFEVFKSAMLPQSMFYVMHSSLFFLFFGASRLSALSINLIYFILLQYFGFYVVYRLTKSYNYALIFLGLLLSCASPYFWAGGINDFRIDFLAICLFGIVIGGILISNVFENRKWALISSFLMIFCCSIRFITSFYFLGIIGLMFFSYFLDFLIFSFKNNWSFNHSWKNYPEKKRVVNFFIFSVIFLIALFFQVYLLKDYLLKYYVVGHYSGVEKIYRLKQIGINNFYDYFMFYPRSFFIDHLGLNFLRIILVIFLLSLVVNLISYFIKRNETLESKVSEIRIFYFLIFSLVSPLIILTSDISKSPVVSSIMTIPFLYLIVYSLWTMNRLSLNKIRVYFEFIIVTICLGYGFFNFISNNVGPVPYINQSPDLYRLYDHLIDYAQTKNKSQLKFGTDAIYDFLGYSSMFDYAYETRHLNIDFSQSYALGGSLNAYSKFQILKGLQNVDFMILNQGSKDKSEILFPSEQKLAENSKLITEFVEQNFNYAGRFELNNHIFNLYLNTRKH